MKRKKDNLISTCEEIYVRAAIVIQRWYRRVKSMEPFKGSHLGSNQIQSRSNLPAGGVPLLPEDGAVAHPFNTSNRDILSLQSNASNPQKRVIIDIVTGSKNHQLPQPCKAPKKIEATGGHNVSFGDKGMEEEKQDSRP